jgi:hypothetical protein
VKKTQLLDLGHGMTVQTTYYAGSRQFIGYRSGTSVFCMDLPSLYRFLGLTDKNPCRQLLDDWLAELDAPVAKEPDMAAIKATGFGPECHGLDETDPNYKTKTII